MPLGGRCWYDKLHAKMLVPRDIDAVSAISTDRWGKGRHGTYFSRRVDRILNTFGSPEQGACETEVFPRCTRSNEERNRTC